MLAIFLGLSRRLLIDGGGTTSVPWLPSGSGIGHVPLCPETKEHRPRAEYQVSSCKILTGAGKNLHAPAKSQGALMAPAPT